MNTSRIVNAILKIKAKLRDIYPVYPPCERKLLEELGEDTLRDVLNIHRMDLRNSQNRQISGMSGKRKSWDGKKV